MRLFVLASFPMVGLLLAAALAGGVFVVMALLYITLLVVVLDKTEGPALPETKGAARDADAVSITLAAAHFLVLFYTLWALGGDRIGTVEKIGLFVAAGLFMGQVSNANAHELIHRPMRGLHRLGMWVYISMLFGHHTSAHVLVHHRHVATRMDPNTSRKGEGFYAYFLRAWIGSFRQGYRAEAARLSRVNRPAWRNPYLVYVGGAALFLALSFMLGGLKTLVLYVALTGYAQSQLLLSDYVQHYGLTRAMDQAGKPHPVGAQHSWNSPHWFSSALMLNATRHSDHHAHPARPSTALTLPEDAPMLPKPLPVMASIALIPPLWRRIMDPAVDRWQHA
ncbi:alkane 1-monooxygenase [Yoonia sp. 2307UL14-13]|uniref:alkane 1-monooxygenase n=1 Tax=Yoonia sp. 2307UL14-13 TaxID=3126506 RepID=UPI0030B1F6CF